MPKDDPIEFDDAVNPTRYWLMGVLALSLLGLLQFVIVVPICMVAFPEDQKLSDYFLSELGRSTHRLGWLFNGSLIFLGLSVIPMFVMLVAIDTKQSLGIRIATFFGIASALGVFLIGMSPVDRNYFGHMAAMALWLFPMLYMIVPFFFSASRSPYVSFWFVATSLAMILIMLIVLLSRQDGDYRLVQKMLASCGTVWLFFIIWYLGQSGFAAINDWEPSSRERIDRKSQEYYDSISKFKTSRNSKNS